LWRRPKDQSPTGIFNYYETDIRAVVVAVKAKLNWDAVTGSIGELTFPYLITLHHFLT
jgi:hypothetical protein